MRLQAFRGPTVNSRPTTALQLASVATGNGLQEGPYRAFQSSRVLKKSPPSVLDPSCPPFHPPNPLTYVRGETAPMRLICCCFSMAPPSRSEGGRGGKRAAPPSSSTTTSPFSSNC
jgi:hypothetical protein